MNIKTEEILHYNNCFKCQYMIFNMESPDQLSRRRFIQKGFGFYLGFSGYFFSDDSNASEISDNDISSYLQDNCRDGLERAIVYVPRTRKIEDISQDRKPESVSFSLRKVSVALRSKRHVVFAHSHIVSLSNLYDKTDPKHVRAMEKYGEKVHKRRLMREAPSSRNQSDMAFFLELLYENFSKEKNPKQEDLTLEFQIIVLESGLKPQIITIQPKKALMDKIRNFNYHGEFGQYMISEFIKDETRVYGDVVDSYYQTHADVFEISDKPEPSFPELARLINKETNFLIRQ
jgi:hypothetical protein